MSKNINLHVIFVYLKKIQNLDLLKMNDIRQSNLCHIISHTNISINAIDVRISLYIFETLLIHSLLVSIIYK